MIVLEVTRNGFFDKIAQKFFKVPAKSDIRLDRTNYFRISILTYQFENKLNLVLPSTFDMEILAEL